VMRTIPTMTIAVTPMPARARSTSRPVMLA
jgi:hypothetical protein